MNEPTNFKHFSMTILYSIFLAALVVLFYGLGVSAFYPAPKAPDYPSKIMTAPVKEGTVSQSPEQVAEQEKYDKAQRIYQKDFQAYNRNVSIITLILAVVTLVISLTIVEKVSFFSDGLLLGGLFTLVYSIIRGFMSEDAKYRFIVVTIGLVVTLVVGYIKFIKAKKEA